MLCVAFGWWPEPVQASTSLLHLRHRALHRDCGALHIASTGVRAGPVGSMSSVPFTGCSSLASCAEVHVGQARPHVLASTPTCSLRLLHGVQGPCSVAAATPSDPAQVLGRDAGTCIVTVSLPRGSSGAVQANLTLAVVTVEDVRVVLGHPEASSAPLEEADQVSKGQAPSAEGSPVAAKVWRSCTHMVMVPSSQAQQEVLAVLAQFQTCSCWQLRMAECCSPPALHQTGSEQRQHQHNFGSPFLAEDRPFAG